MIVIVIVVVVVVIVVVVIVVVAAAVVAVAGAFRRLRRRRLRCPRRFDLPPVELGGDLTALDRLGAEGGEDELGLGLVLEGGEAVSPGPTKGGGRKRWMMTRVVCQFLVLA